MGKRLAGLVAPTGTEVIAHTSALPDADGHWPVGINEPMQLFVDEAKSVLDPPLERLSRREVRSCGGVECAADAVEHFCARGAVR